MQFPWNTLLLAAISTLGLLAQPLLAHGAGYYNLGAFWRTQSSAACLVSTPVLVQTLDSGDGSSSVNSFTETAGNTLIAAVEASESGPTVVVTDTAGNTWHPLTALRNSNAGCGAGQFVQLWYATNIVGGANSVTAQFTPSSGDPWVQIAEYSGLSATNLVYSSVGAIGSNPNSATLNAGSITVGHDGGIILATFSDWNACGPMTAGSGYTERFSGGCYTTILEDRFAPQGTYPTDATNVVNSNCWAAAAVALNPTCTPVTNPQPTITGITPWGGTAGGGTSITITGTQFDSSASVTLGGQDCPITSRTGSTTLVCTAPAHAAGTVDVVVTDTGGNSATLSHGYVYGACSTISFVQSAISGTGNDRAQSVTLSSETAGNLLVVEIYDSVWVTNPDSRAKISITDTAGNTYYRAPQQDGGDAGRAGIWYAPNIAGGPNTITVHTLPQDISGRAFGNVGFMVQEYSGAATSNVVDFGSLQGSTPVTSLINGGTGTVASDCKDLVVGFFLSNWGSCGQGMDMSSAMPGWTARASESNWAAFVEDNAALGSGPGSTISATAQTSRADDCWIGSQVAFRAQSSSQPQQPNHLAFTTSSQTMANTWQCSGALTIQAQNSSNQPVNVPTPLDISLSGSGVAYYEDDDCEIPITATQIPAGLNSQTVYFSGAAQGSPSLTASSSGLTSATQGATIGAIVPFTWIGGASCDGNWSTAACWQGGAVPGSSDTAHFDANCSSHCSVALTADTTVGSVWMHIGSTDTLTISGHQLSTSTSGGTGILFVQGGTLTVSAGGTLNANGPAYIDGGNVTFAGQINLSDNYAVSGGTVNAAGSTVSFAQNPGCSSFSIRLSPGNVAYNNVVFADFSNCGYLSREFDPGNSMTILGTLTLGSQGSVRSSLWGGTLGALGNVVIQDLGVGGDAWLKIEGNGNQLIDVSSTSTGKVPSLSLASTGGTATFKGDPIVEYKLEYISGTFDFTTFDSTLRFQLDPGCSSQSVTISPGNLVYNNIAFQDVSNCGQLTRSMIGSGVMNIQGNLTLDSDGGVIAALHDGVYQVAKNVIVNHSGAVGDSVIKMAGSSSQLLDASGGTYPQLPSLTLASTGGTLTVKGDPVIVQDFKHQSGNIDFLTYNTTLRFITFWGCSYPTISIDPGTAAYYNVFIADTVGCGFATRSLATGTTMDVRGNFSLGSPWGLNWLTGGTIAVRGNITVTDMGYKGDTEIKAVGTGTQVLDVSGASEAHIPSLTLASSGTVRFKGDPIIWGNYAYASGTADFTTFDSGLAFLDDAICYYPNRTIDPGSIDYNRVTFMDTPGCGYVTRTFAPGSTMKVKGLLTFDVAGASGAVLNGGTIAAYKDVVFDGHGYSGTTKMDFTGSTASNLSILNGASTMTGDVTVSKSASTLTLQTDVDWGGSLSVTFGSLLMSGHDLNIDANLNLDAGTSITRGGGTLTYGSGPTGSGTIN